ncbi:MAG: endonuclease domain-containing protein [Chloroflexi bacterium]|nr:endonuclease domain-containing protein [Chloroflexota bacterium]
MQQPDNTTTLREQARALRRNQTEAERNMWSRLRARRLLGLKFRRQQRLGPYIVDFCCLEIKLVIEIDGGQHNFDTNSDLKRSNFLKQEGYSVLRFWNDEIFTNSDGVLERIRESCITLTLALSPQGRGS